MNRNFGDDSAARGRSSGERCPTCNGLSHRAQDCPLRGEVSGNRERGEGSGGGGAAAGRAATTTRDISAKVEKAAAEETTRESTRVLSSTGGDSSVSLVASYSSVVGGGGNDIGGGGRNSVKFQDDNTSNNAGSMTPLPDIENTSRTVSGGGGGGGLFSKFRSVIENTFSPTPQWVTDTLDAANKALDRENRAKVIGDWGEMLRYFRAHSAGDLDSTRFADTTAKLADKVAAALLADKSLSASLYVLPLIASLAPLHEQQRGYHNPHKVSIEKMMKMARDRIAEDLLLPDTEDEHGTSLTRQLVLIWATDHSCLEEIHIACGSITRHAPNSVWNDIFSNPDYYILYWASALGGAASDVLLKADPALPRPRTISSLQGALGLLSESWEISRTRPALCASSSPSLATTVGIQGHRALPQRAKFPFHKLYLPGILNTARVLCVSAQPLQPYFKTAALLVRRAVENEPRRRIRGLISDHHRAFEFVADLIRPICVHEALLLSTTDGSKLISDLVQSSLILEDHFTLETMPCVRDLFEKAPPAFRSDLACVAAEAIVLYPRNSNFRELDDAWASLCAEAGDVMPIAVGHILREAARTNPNRSLRVTLKMVGRLAVPRQAAHVFSDWLKMQVHSAVKGGQHNFEKARQIAEITDNNATIFQGALDDPLLVIVKGALIDMAVGGHGSVAENLKNAVLTVATIATISTATLDPVVGFSGSHDREALAIDLVRIISRHVPGKAAEWFGSLVASFQEMEAGWDLKFDTDGSLISYRIFAAALATSVGGTRREAGISSEMLTDELLLHFQAAGKKKEVREMCFVEGQYLSAKVSILRDTFVGGVQEVGVAAESVPRRLGQLLECAGAVSMSMLVETAFREIAEEAGRRVHLLISSQATTGTLLKLLTKAGRGDYTYAPNSATRWEEIVAALNTFSSDPQGTWTKETTTRAIKGLLREAESEIERNQEAGTAFRFLESQNARGRGMANLELSKEVALSKSVEDLKAHNDDQLATFREIHPDAFRALAKLGRQGTMFERAFSRQLDELRENDSELNGKSISKAILDATVILRTMVQDDDNTMDIDAFVVQLSVGGATGGSVSELIESRGIEEIAKDFRNMSEFFEGARGSGGNFALKVTNFKATVPLLQYRMHVHAMVEALRDVGALSGGETEKFNDLILILSDNFKLVEAPSILRDVQRIVTVKFEGDWLYLSPTMCQMLASLQRADVVISSLRSPHLIEDDAFVRAMTQAKMHASMDKRALDRLDEVIYLRALIKPWLAEAVPFHVVARGVFEQLNATEEVKNSEDDESARDVAAIRLMNLIENCSRSWQHTFTFFDGKNDAVAAAELIKLVPTYLLTGRYFGRLPVGSGNQGSLELMFKYHNVDGDVQVPRVEFELQPDVLLEQTRFAVLSCSRAPDETTKLALERFKQSYTCAVDLLKERQALAMAGHPRYQKSGFVLLAEYAEPAALKSQIDDARSELRAWTTFVSVTIKSEPRIRLLTPMNRLSALCAVIDHGRSDLISNSASLAKHLEPYVLQAFPETFTSRTEFAFTLKDVCSKVLPRFVEDLALDPGADFSMNLLVAVVQGAAVELSTARRINANVATHKVELNGLVYVVEVPSSDSAPGIADSAYVAHLGLVCADSENGVAPAQVLWCSGGTTEAEVNEWASLALVPNLIGAVAAMYVDRLRGPSRQALAAVFVDKGGRAGCDVFLVFGAHSGMRSFSSFARYDQPLVREFDRINDVLLALHGAAAPPANTSARVIEVVQVVAGGPRSGKSRYVDFQLEQDAVIGTVHIALHEGFQVGSAIKQYAEVVSTAGFAGGIGTPVVGFHFDLYDVEGLDLASVSKVLHVLFSAGMLVDENTGESLFLLNSVRHRVYIELPALCALSSYDGRGPRDIWPPAHAAWNAKHHPFLPKMGPLLLLNGDSFKKITTTTWPLLMDVDASRVAAYIRFSNQCRGERDRNEDEEEQQPTEDLHSFLETEGLQIDSTAAQVEAFWMARSADLGGHETDRRAINDAIDAVPSGLTMSIGTRAAVVRSMAISLRILDDLAVEFRRPSDVIRGIHLWAKPHAELGPAFMVPYLELLSQKSFMPGFFELFVQLQVQEAVCLFARSSQTSVWCLSHKLHNPESSAVDLMPHFLICGPSPPVNKVAAGLIERLSTEVKTRSDGKSEYGKKKDEDDGKQIAKVCHVLAPVFGLKNGGRLTTILEDAGFVLTPEIAGQLLLLHGRRRVCEPLIFEGDTGAGKSFLFELFSVLVNRDPGIVFNGRHHLVSVLQATSDRHTDGVHAAGWRLLKNLTEDSNATEITRAVRSLVALDPQPHSRELGAAIGVYFSVQCSAFPLMKDGAGSNLSRLMSGVSNFRAEPQRGFAFETARAADVVPSDVEADVIPVSTVGPDGDANCKIQRAKEEEETLVRKTAKWHAAETVVEEVASSVQWRDLDRYADLEKVLQEAIQMKPRGLFKRFVMHEGIGCDEWRAIVDDLRGEALRLDTLNARATLVVFVDELNTAGALGAVTETVASHRLDGACLPENILFVAAINPSTNEGASKTSAASQGIGDFRYAPPSSICTGAYKENEDLEEYMPAFVVKPTPSCLEPLIVVHAGLEGNSEIGFLKECFRGRKIPGLKEALSESRGAESEFIELAVDSISTSQNSVRNFQVPRVHVSIRDPLRALRLFVWLCRVDVSSEKVRAGKLAPPKTVNPFLPGSCKPGHKMGTALVVSLALTYWCRLPSFRSGRFAGRDDREDFATILDVGLIQSLMQLKMLPRGSNFQSIISAAFDHLWSFTDAVPAGIVGTAGLKEAFYAVVAAIHTRTAVLLTGPAGCGKTLSLMLASRCLVGRSGETNVIFQGLLHVVSETFQCNETTTASEVKAAYKKVERTQRSLDDTDPGKYAVVLALDEAGLPKSRRQALKGLHDPLEQGKVSSVFMSNVTLDAAKTSRMLQVLMSQPTEKDLVDLARGLMFGRREKCVPIDHPFSKRVAGLAAAYSQLPQKLPSEWWFGERDLIYLTKQLAFSTASASREEGDWDGDMLIAGLRRNFQTLDPSNFEKLATHFLNCCNLDVPREHSALGAFPLRTLQEKALSDEVEGGEEAFCTHFRHILLIDRSQSELSLDVLRLLRRDLGFKVVALADFAEDKHPTNQAEALADIRDAVEEGRTIVLLNTGPLHSALYSLLNRHYTSTKNLATGQEEPVVFLAIGALARTIRVHPSSKIIVLLSSSDLQSTPLPFLSRFERYVVGADDALELFNEQLLSSPPSWLGCFERETQLKFLTGIQPGVEDFMERIGFASFPGATRIDTSAALVLGALNQSRGIDLRIPNAFRDLSVECAAELNSCSPRLELVIRQLNLLVMQQVTVAHALQASFFLPHGYKAEYVLSQCHFSGIDWLQGVVSGRLQNEAGGPAFAPVDVNTLRFEATAEAVRAMLLIPSCTALETLGVRILGIDEQQQRSRQTPSSVLALGEFLGFCGSFLASEDLDVAPTIIKSEKRSGLLCVLSLDACRSGSGCKNQISSFTGAASTLDAEGRSMLLVLANMSIVDESQVRFARRCVDEVVDRISMDVVFLLHRPAEEMSFRRPVVHTTSIEWHFVSIDDWGILKSTTPTSPLLGEEETEGADDRDEGIDPAPWLKMLFGIADTASIDSAKAAFRDHVRDQLSLALRKCAFPRQPFQFVPSLLFADPAYRAGGDKHQSAEWVLKRLMERPYIFDALVSAFGVVWQDEVVRIGDALRASATHHSLATAMKRSARWLFADFLGLFVAKHLAVQWGLDALVSLPATSGAVGSGQAQPSGVDDTSPEERFVDNGDNKKEGGLREENNDKEDADNKDDDSDGGGSGGDDGKSLGLEQEGSQKLDSQPQIDYHRTFVGAASKLIEAVLFGAALDHRTALATTATHGNANILLVTCDASVAARTPMFASLLTQLRRFRAVVSTEAAQQVPPVGLSAAASSSAPEYRSSREAAVWRDLSSRPEWQHLRVALREVSRSTPLRQAFFGDFVRLALEQFDASDVQLLVYARQAEATLKEMIDDEGGGGGRRGYVGLDEVDKDQQWEGYPDERGMSLLPGPSVLVLHEVVLRSAFSGLRGMLASHAAAATAIEESALSVNSLEPAASTRRLSALLAKTDLNNEGAGSCVKEEVKSDTLELLWEGALQLVSYVGVNTAAVETWVAAARGVVLGGGGSGGALNFSSGAHKEHNQGAVMVALFHLLAAVSAAPCGVPHRPSQSRRVSAPPAADALAAAAAAVAEVASFKPELVVGDGDVAAAMLFGAPLEEAAGTHGMSALDAGFRVIAFAKGQVEALAAEAGAEAACSSLAALRGSLRCGVREAVIHFMRWSLPRSGPAALFPPTVSSRSAVHAVAALCDGGAATGHYASLGELGDHARASLLARLLSVAGVGTLPTARGAGRGDRGGIRSAVCHALEKALETAVETSIYNGDASEGADQSLLFVPTSLVAARAILLPIRGRGEAGDGGGGGGDGGGGSWDGEVAEGEAGAAQEGTQNLWLCSEAEVVQLIFRATMLAASTEDEVPFTPSVESATDEVTALPSVLAKLGHGGDAGDNDGTDGGGGGDGARRKGIAPRFAALRSAVADLRLLRSCAVRLTACLVSANAPLTAPSLERMLGSDRSAMALVGAIRKQPTAAGLYLLAKLTLPACALALRSQILLQDLACPHLGMAAPAVAAAAGGSAGASFLNTLRARVLIQNAEQGFEPPTAADLSGSIRAVHVERAELSRAAAVEAAAAAAAARAVARPQNGNGDNAEVLAWAEVTGRLLHPSRRGAMAMAKHAPAVANLMSFARQHFADAYTADEALTTPVAEALERLPRGDRDTGWLLLKDFLRAWAELKAGLETYEMCPAEARAVGALGAAIEPLVADKAAAGGVGEGRGGGGVVVTVANLVGLPGEEAVSSHPAPRMLAGRLLKDSNAVAGSPGVAAVLADASFNLRGALGGVELPPTLLASDVPWQDAPAARGLLVTGASPGLEEEKGGGSMDREIDDVVGFFARWASGPKGEAETAAACRWALEEAKRVAEEAELERSDRVERVRQRIIDDELYIRCPRCAAVFVDYEGCDALTCGCGAGFCALCLVDCGSDAHPHVISTHGTYHGGHGNFQKHHSARRTASVKAALVRLNEDLGFKYELVGALKADLAEAGLDSATLALGLVAGGAGEGAPPARPAEGGDGPAGGSSVLDLLRNLAETESRLRQASASAAHATLCPRCLRVDESAPATGVFERSCPFRNCSDAGGVVSTIKCRVPPPTSGQALLPYFAPPSDDSLASLLADFSMKPSHRARLPELVGGTDRDVGGRWEVDAARVGRWLFSSTLFNRSVIATTVSEAQRATFDAAITATGPSAGRVRAPPAAAAAELDAFFAPLRLLDAPMAVGNGGGGGGGGGMTGGVGGSSSGAINGGGVDQGGNGSAEVVDPMARLLAARHRLLLRAPPKTRAKPPENNLLRGLPGLCSDDDDADDDGEDTVGGPSSLGEEPLDPAPLLPVSLERSLLAAAIPYAEHNLRFLLDDLALVADEAARYRSLGKPDPPATPLAKLLSRTTPPQGWCAPFNAWIGRAERGLALPSTPLPPPPARPSGAMNLAALPLPPPPPPPPSFSLPESGLQLRHLASLCALAAKAYSDCAFSQYSALQDPLPGGLEARLRELPALVAEETGRAVAAVFVASSWSSSSLSPANYGNGDEEEEATLNRALKLSLQSPSTKGRAEVVEGGGGGGDDDFGGNWVEEEKRVRASELRLAGLQRAVETLAAALLAVAPFLPDVDEGLPLFDSVPELQAELYRCGGGGSGGGSGCGLSLAPSGAAVFGGGGEQEEDPLRNLLLLPETWQDAPCDGGGGEGEGPGAVLRVRHFGSFMRALHAVLDATLEAKAAAARRVEELAWAQGGTGTMAQSASTTNGGGGGGGGGMYKERLPDNYTEAAKTAGVMEAGAGGAAVAEASAEEQDSFTEHLLTPENGSGEPALPSLSVRDRARGRRREVLNAAQVKSTALNKELYASHDGREGASGNNANGVGSGSAPHSSAPRPAECRLERILRRAEEERLRAEGLARVAVSTLNLPMETVVYLLEQGALQSAVNSSDRGGVCGGGGGGEEEEEEEEEVTDSLSSVGSGLPKFLSYDSVQSCLDRCEPLTPGATSLGRVACPHLSPAQVKEYALKFCPQALPPGSIFSLAPFMFPPPPRADLGGLRLGVLKRDWEAYEAWVAQGEAGSKSARVHMCEACGEAADQAEDDEDGDRFFEASNENHDVDNSTDSAVPSATDLAAGKGNGEGQTPTMPAVVGSVSEGGSTTMGNGGAAAEEVAGATTVSGGPNKNNPMKLQTVAERLNSPEADVEFLVEEGFLETKRVLGGKQLRVMWHENLAEDLARQLVGLGEAAGAFQVSSEAEAESALAAAGVRCVALNGKLFATPAGLAAAAAAAAATRVQRQPLVTAEDLGAEEGLNAGDLAFLVQRGVLEPEPPSNENAVAEATLFNRRAAALALQSRRRRQGGRLEGWAEVAARAAHDDVSPGELESFLVAEGLQTVNLRGKRYFVDEDADSAVGPLDESELPPVFLSPPVAPQTPTPSSLVFASTGDPSKGKGPSAAPITPVASFGDPEHKKDDGTSLVSETIELLDQPASEMDDSGDGSRADDMSFMSRVQDK